MYISGYLIPPKVTSSFFSKAKEITNQTKVGRISSLKTIVPENYTPPPSAPNEGSPELIYVQSSFMKSYHEIDHSDFLGFSFIYFPVHVSPIVRVDFCFPSLFAIS